MIVFILRTIVYHLLKKMLRLFFRFDKKASVQGIFPLAFNEPATADWPDGSFGLFVERCHEAKNQKPPGFVMFVRYSLQVVQESLSIFYLLLGVFLFGLVVSYHLLLGVSFFGLVVSHLAGRGRSGILVVHVIPL